VLLDLIIHEIVNAAAIAYITHPDDPGDAVATPSLMPCCRPMMDDGCSLLTSSMQEEFTHVPEYQDAGELRAAGDR
jgi:hypothetical protein